MWDALLEMCGPVVLFLVNCLCVHSDSVHSFGDFKVLGKFGVSFFIPIEIE